MDFFFKSNESFSYEALRAAGYSNYGGADIAEVMAICTRIRPGNEEDWAREWSKAAERAVSLAKLSESVGNLESSYHSYLRASNYFRTADFFRRDSVATDKTSQLLYENSESSFLVAMKLSPFTYEAIAIPYEGTSLPGYFVGFDNIKKPRRTIIFNGGFDSTASEGWFAIGAAALARGYNFLSFDGPGQGAAIRQQGLHFRHDWEQVLTPVMDYALTRADVDSKSVVIFGWSMGGYLVARGATQEHRAKAIILDDGVYDFGAAFRAQQPFLIQTMIDREYDAICNWIFDCAQHLSTGIRWALQNAKWTFGVDSVSEFLRLVKKYTLKGLSQHITTPTLVIDAENDHFLKGQPDILSKHLQCEHELISLRQEEGGDMHCHQGAFFRVHQVIFDFLEPRLSD